MMGGDDEAVEGSVEADSKRELGLDFFSIGGCWSTGKNWHSLRSRMQFSQRPWASSAATKHRIFRRRQCTIWSAISISMRMERKKLTTCDRGAMITQLVALLVRGSSRGGRGRVHGGEGVGGHGFDHGGHRRKRKRLEESRDWKIPGHAVGVMV